MARGQPRCPLGLLAEVIVAPAEHLDRSPDPLVGQIVGILLAPLEASLGTVNPDAQVVLLSRGNLRGDHDALGATLVADQEVAVVVEASALDEGGQVGADLGHLETGYRVDQVFGVGAYVSDGPSYPRARWVGTPLGLLSPGLLESAGQPTLVVLDYDLPDFAQQSFVNHVPCLLDHRVSRVIVGHGEDDAAALHHPRQVLSLLGGRSEERRV